jgi:hypothetical protein
MINIKFYEDAEGYFKADSDAEYRLLGEYFESEIQGVAGVCEDVLNGIKEIELGDRALIEGVGNGYGLRLTAITATIWSEFTETESVLEIPLSDFKQVMEKCLKACG